MTIIELATTANSSTVRRALRVSADCGDLLGGLPIMDPMSRWRDLTVNVPFSRLATWMFRIWCVLAITILSWIYIAENALGALFLVPSVLMLLAASEGMAWSYRRKKAQLAEAGMPIIAVVTGKGFASRGGLAWVSAEYCVAGHKTESAAYVSRRTSLHCRVGDQMPIRVLQGSPRFWIAERDVEAKLGNVGR